MVVALYFLVSAGFAAWLLPHAPADIEKELEKDPLPEEMQVFVRTGVGVLYFAFILFWPAMIVFVYTRCEGRWR